MNNLSQKLCGMWRGCVVQGLTLLHWAADRGHADIVRLLVDIGATVNSQVCTIMYYNDLLILALKKWLHLLALAISKQHWQLFSSDCQHICFV